MSERINLAELRADLEHDIHIESQGTAELYEEVLALVEAVEAAQAFVGEMGGSELDRLDAALARFDFREPQP